MTTTDHRWDEFLSTMETHLADQRLLLDEERYDSIEPMFPPSDLPPMPEKFAGRTAAALADSMHLEQAVSDRMESVARELVQLPRTANRQPVDAGRRGLLDTAL